MSDSVGGVAEQEPDLVQRAIELSNAAIPAPWKTDKWNGGAYIVGQVPGGRPGGEVIADMRPSVPNMKGYPVSAQHASAEFIAAARSLVPALAVELRAVRGDLLTTREALAEAVARIAQMERDEPCCGICPGRCYKLMLEDEDRAAAMEGKTK